MNGELLAVLHRMRRKAEIVKLDAPAGSPLYFDMQEVLALVEMAERAALATKPEARG